MTTSPLPATTGQQPLLDSVFGRLWPDRGIAGRPRLAAAALGAGVLAAVVLPYRDAGLGTFLVLVAAVGVVAVAHGRRTPRAVVSAGLVLALLSMLVVRDADWVVALCVLAALTVSATELTGARSVPGLLASLVAVPLAGLRGLPWLARSVRVGGGRTRWWAAARTGLVSVALLVVFGALFSSADAVFASWVDALVPDLTVPGLALRTVVLVLVTGVTLAGVYVAVAPPRVDRLALPAATPVRRFEWAVPVGAVVATFVGFLAAQSTALFGGHDHLRRTTGLTYAEYVHQGFGQLTVATMLTLAVVAAAVHRAGRESSSDRTLLRTMLGLLCALTLVVVASALYRMHIYEEAYGFTRLRLLVSLFEAWLGVVVAMVMLSGRTLRAPWLPRAALLAGATMLLGLGVLNPDRFIAEQNLERDDVVAPVDVHYLSGLSADAAPALVDVPELTPPCLHQDDWLEWNLGRDRAQGLLPACAAAADRPAGVVTAP